MNRAVPGTAAEWHALGLERQRAGDRAGALEALSKAAELDRRVARYQQDLANALLDDGKVDRAISVFRRALRIDESLAEAHNDLGTAYFQKGWHAEAEECFRKAIERKPGHGIAHANLGAALRAQGRLSESRRAYQRALLLKVRAWLPSPLRWRLADPGARRIEAPAAADEVRGQLKSISELLAAGHTDKAFSLSRKLEREHPEDPDVLQVAGLVLEERRDIAGALERTRAAVAAKPDRAEYQVALARLLAKSGNHGAALEAGWKALKLEPGSADVHATIAGIYHPWREDLAEQAARRAVELDPGSHAGHGNLAAALWGLGKLEEAEKHGREAIRLKPDQVMYQANLALICKDLGRIDEARELYRGLLQRAPDHAKIATDLGTLAVECEGDLETGRRWYRKAHAGGEARGLLSEGMVDLLEGRFETAWEKYEARKEVADQRYQHSIFGSLPAWDGARAPVGRLLVYGEQGLGDEIMFASMFAELERTVGHVSVMCDARLGPLFRRSFPRFEVIAQARESQERRVATLENIGAVVAAGSLGRLFRRRREDFPAHRGYLVADPGKAAAWREKLGPGLKVGISWIGGLQKTGRSRRSLSVAQLEPLLARAGISWVSLQHAAESPAHPSIAEYPGVTSDLDELAALIGALDLVVSVCNTNVHLAGALGKEVLVMAPFVPEWRYGLSGPGMVWYPSARVFRQSRYGDWSDVLSAVSEALARRTL